MSHRRPTINGNNARRRRTDHVRHVATTTKPERLLAEAPNVLRKLRVKDQQGNRTATRRKRSEEQIIKDPRSTFDADARWMQGQRIAPTLPNVTAQRPLQARKRSGRTTGRIETIHNTGHNTSEPSKIIETVGENADRDMSRKPKDNKATLHRKKCQAQ